MTADGPVTGRPRGGARGDRRVRRQRAEHGPGLRLLAGRFVVVDPIIPGQRGYFEQADRDWSHNRVTQSGRGHTL